MLTAQDLIKRLKKTVEPATEIIKRNVPIANAVSTVQKAITNPANVTALRQQYNQLPQRLEPLRRSYNTVTQGLKQASNYRQAVPLNQRVSSAFQDVKQNPIKYSLYGQMAQSPIKPIRYGGKAIEGTLEGLSANLIDIPAPVSTNNADRLAYVGGNVLGMFNPSSALNLTGKVVSKAPVISQLQEPLGSVAGKLIAKGGASKLAGKAVANLSQGVPYTLGYAGLKQAISPVTGQKYSKGDLAGDIGVDLAIGAAGAFPIFAGLSKMAKDKRIRVVLQNEFNVKEAIWSANNFKTFDPNNQIRAIAKIKDVADKVIPEVVNSKEMKKTQIYSPAEWMRTTTRFLEDALVQAKNPSMDIGLSTRQLGKLSKSGVTSQTVQQTQQISPQTKLETPQSRVPLVNTPQPLMSQGKQVDQLSQLKKQPKKQLLDDQVMVQSQALDNIIAEGRRSIGSAKQESNRPVKQVLNDLYTQWVDRYHPLSRASKQAKNVLRVKGAELRPEYDPEYLVRRLTGAGGIADYRFQTELKPVIDEVDKLGIPKVDIDAYLAHNRMAGFGDIGRELIGVNPVKSKQIVSSLELKYPEIKNVAQKLYSYQGKGLQELVDAGFISQDALKAMRSQNPNYAPLYRVMDEMNDYLGLPTRKTMQGTNPVLRIKGSEKKIESPLESIIGNTFKQRAAIEKNRVAQSIVGLNKVADMGFEKATKSGNDTITVWNNGNKEYWRVGSDIADVAKGVNEEVTNTLLKIIQAPAQLLRQGATGRNPSFMIPNIIRDQLDAGITSKYGYIPFVDYVSGLKSMLKNDAVYQKWQSSGAKIDLGELSGKKSITKLFDEKKSKKRLYQWITDGLDVMGKYSEQPTRVGLFKKAYQKTGNELLAAMESRDATVDFARMGSKMKVANSIIPFLNVGVQGFDKLVRALKNNPKKVLFNMGIYGATPAIATTIYNLQNYPQEYAEIPQYEKDDNFVIVKGRNPNGAVDYIKFPKGNVAPIVANPIQSFMEYLAGVDGKSFSELAISLVSDTLPVLEGGNTPREVLVKTTGSMIPQFAKPIIEDITNKSFYKYDSKKEAQGKESGVIVPNYLKSKPPYQQTYEFTPQMYQKIGAVLNVSPLRVKNMMEGYLAGYAKIPTQIIEMMNAISKGETINPNDKTVVSRFIGQTYPSSTKKSSTEPQAVPNLMERVTGKVDASTNISIPQDQETFNDLYKDASKKAKFKEEKRMIEFDPTLDDREKQEKIDKLQERSVAWSQVLAEMENGHPEKVFEAQIETYKTGSGSTVEERGEWVYKKLDTAKDEKELQSMINQLWEEKVLTSGSSGVAQYLEDNYGIELKYTGTSKKVKGGRGKKLKIGSTVQMKQISVSSPRVSQTRIQFAKPRLVNTQARKIKIKPSLKLTKVRFT